MLVDEGDSQDRSYVLSYGGQISCEYDINNNWNFLFDFGYSKPMVFGSGRIISNEFFILSVDTGARFYPYASKQSSLIQSEEGTVLIENKRAHINPYLSTGIASKFLINNSPLTVPIENMTTVGVFFSAGIDFPVNNRWGFNVSSPFQFLMTVSTPTHIIFVFGMNLGTYINF